MTEYDKRDMEDPEQEIVRPKGTKRHSSFSYCKWAAGDWEARFYAWTPAHRKECEFSVNQMANNPAWFKTRKPKVDKLAAAHNNKARSKKRRAA